MKHINFLRVALFLLLTSIFCNCTKEEKLTEQELTQWIEAFTPEVINPVDNIVIIPTELFISSYAMSDAEIEDIITFSPSIKGEFNDLVEDGAIIFTPKEGELKCGKTYTCKIDFKRLTQTDTIKNYSFDFAVAERYAYFTDINLNLDENSAKKVIITGKVRFNVPLAKDAKEVLKCSYKASKVEFAPTADSLLYTFTISNICRTKELFDVTLSLNEKLGYYDIKESVMIPNFADFNVFKSEFSQGNKPTITITFNNQLSNEQDLDGLITVDNAIINKIEKKNAVVVLHLSQCQGEEVVLYVSDLVKNSDGERLASEYVYKFSRTLIPPQVEIPLKGTIMADISSLKVPFKAVNLAAVDVEVIKIYTSNVLNYLQSNDINSRYSLRSAGRLVYRQTVRLDKNKKLDLHQWNNFSIDLSNMIKEEPGAIYTVRVLFSQDYSLYGKDKVGDIKIKSGLTDEDKREWDETYSYSCLKTPDGRKYGWDYDWSKRDDPTNRSYYINDDKMGIFSFMATNIGLSAKWGDTERLWCVTTDLKNGTPLAGVDVVAYNYQLQPIGKGRTNNDGLINFKTDGTPYIVVATKDNYTTLLKLEYNNKQSYSKFDISGEKYKGGVKTFVYTERGVYRPGDDIYLTLIVEDKEHKLPKNHPVTMEFYNPNDVLVDKQVLTKGVDGFYSFKAKTLESDLTGLYTARFSVGTVTTTHYVRVETVTPNRLKINIKAPEIMHANKEEQVSLDVKYLTGVVAKNNRVYIELNFFKNSNPFKKYSKYRFSNPLISYTENSVYFGGGKLDEDGKYCNKGMISNSTDLPGMLQANINVEVEEPGGGISISSKSVKYSPFSEYVGVLLPEEIASTDTDIKIPVVVVNEKGEVVPKSVVKYTIYEMGWEWWWQRDSEYDLNNYVRSASNSIVEEGTLELVNGKGNVPFRVDYPDWGKYLLIVKDEKSNHISGGTFRVDWPSWRGRSDKSDKEAVTILPISLNKKEYSVGDSAILFLPKATSGKVLVSLEKGDKIISQKWVTLSSSNETSYKFVVTDKMAPNFYVHTTMVQPLAQTLNDAPIRMYGVAGAKVTDLKKKLCPVITLPKSIEPQKKFNITIKEQNNKPMTYTLAIVDEGLLDLTAFKTPNPWAEMNKKEGLYVRTWDMYEDVIGAYTGLFPTILSVGGDDAIRSAEGKEKRFNPIVKFIGPVTLKSGTKTHTITLPMYVGSVRVMVVAAHDGCYGSAQETMQVKSDLMIMPTLPRLLNCGDIAKLPITIFSTNKAFKKAEVKVTLDGPAKLKTSKKSINLKADGETLTTFDIECDKSKSGKLKVFIDVKSENKVVKDTLYIDVKKPALPPQIKSYNAVIQGNESATLNWKSITKGSTVLEVSTMPRFDFSGIYEYHKNYRHLCTEQLSSKAMFILYARQYLTADEQKAAQKEIDGILKALEARQMANGSFSYWANGNWGYDWATSMVGEVLCTAKKQGFNVKSTTLKKWSEYQNSLAKAYRHTTSYANDLEQAYRLYTLVLNGEKPIALMNRLKESKSMSRAAAFKLAAAYVKLGNKEVAKKLIEQAADYKAVAGTCRSFYSTDRDKAIMIEAYALVGEYQKALPLVKELADVFEKQYYSTQTIAFTAVALNQFAGSSPKNYSYSINLQDGTSTTYNNFVGCQAKKINNSDSTITVKNNSEQMLFASLITKRERLSGESVSAKSNGVSLQIVYTDLNGARIDVANVAQGSEFFAKITISGLKEDCQSMALSYVIPAGWEICSSRKDVKDGKWVDIRDDRYCHYFAMEQGQTREFDIRVRASYCGTYFVTPTIVEDMYNPRVSANSATSTVTIIK